MKEARARRDLIAGELAAGRNRADLLRAEQPSVRTFAEEGRRWMASRVDLAEKTRRTYSFALASLEASFGDRYPADITPADVREWVGANAVMRPASLRLYLFVLRHVLDFAGVEPNPARDRSVKLPREERSVVEPPGEKDVATILATVPPRWRLPLRVLAETGMRVGEAHALEWRDVDLASSRFRIRSGKTKAARRWVTVPEAVMEAVAEPCPPDDRTAERRLFPGFTPDGALRVMGRACKAAGIAHYTPHDLRHRFASVQIARGVPVTDLAAHLGHTKKSMTLDVYSHVLLAD
jgi:integrase